MQQKTQAVIDREAALESFVVWLAQRRCMAETEMARRFARTKTCARLMDVKSSLWEESNLYILDLWNWRSRRTGTAGCTMIPTEARGGRTAPLFAVRGRKKDLETIENCLI